MKRKIIIAVAPVGGWGTERNNPVLSDDLVRQVRQCADEGAAVLHLHSRDAKGQLSAGTSYFDSILDIISTEVPILIEASTGGLSQMTAEERCRPAENKKASFGSLNMGSLNFTDDVYQNPLPSIRLWIEKMRKAGVHPSLEIFDTGHLETALYLIREGALKPPYNFSFIFNCKWGMSYSYHLLMYLAARLPQQSNWGCIFAGNTDFTMHLEAALCGAGFLRVGFEDSIFIDGREAAGNAELVKELRLKLEILGFEIASLSEAKNILSPA